MDDFLYLAMARDVMRRLESVNVQTKQVGGARKGYECRKGIKQREEHKGVQKLKNSLSSHADT